MQNVSKYIQSLPIQWSYKIHGTNTDRIMTAAGITNNVSMVQRTGGVIGKRMDIITDPLLLSDEFELESGEDEGTEPYRIAEGQYTLGIINDIHIPFHNLEALKAAIHTMRERLVNKILINGDLLDFHGLSRFIKNPAKQFIKDEIELGKQFFKQLRKLFSSEEIIYKYGNHDSRLTTFIYEKAAPLYGLDAIQLSELLLLKDLGVKAVMPEQIVRAGKLNIIHGHEFPSNGGVVNVARTMRLKANDNIAMGHFHRTQTDHATSIDGSMHGSYAVGCLCNLRPKWYPMAYTTWNHGFAIVEVEADGRYSFENKKIIAGRVV